MQSQEGPRSAAALGHQRDAPTPRGHRPTGISLQGDIGPLKRARWRPDAIRHPDGKEEHSAELGVAVTLSCASKPFWRPAQEAPRALECECRRRRAADTSCSRPDSPPAREAYPSVRSGAKSSSAPRQWRWLECPGAACPGDEYWHSHGLQAYDGRGATFVTIGSGSAPRAAPPARAWGTGARTRTRRRSTSPMQHEPEARR
jgi:hypothetical protein